MAVEPCMYLSAALDTIKTHALRRDSVNWSELRADAFDAARGARAIGEAYPAVEQTLQALGDNHSHFLPASEVEKREENVHYETPSGRMLGDHLAPAPVAYLSLPGFNRTDEATMQKYADTAQDIIWQLQHSNPCGWIVSLQGNGGGNMWPMLAGIGPLLGEGQVGSFIAPEYELPWFYRHGAAMLGDRILTKVPDPVEAVSPEDVPVAVLTSIATSSAAEAIAIAFRGRPNTRSFGQPTGGVPTGNAPFELSDGAMLILTVSQMADRTGHIYRGRIEPEVTQEGNTALESAAEWIASTGSCQHATEQ
jgi:C-terminal processing protease CtpA/Prc